MRDDDHNYEADKLEQGSEVIIIREKSGYFVVDYDNATYRI